MVCLQVKILSGFPPPCFLEKRRGGEQQMAAETLNSMLKRGMSACLRGRRLTTGKTFLCKKPCTQHGYGVLMMNLQRSRFY